MVTEAQKRANAAYRKKSVKQLTMRFYPNEADEEMYAWLKSQENTTEYLKALVRADMESRREDEEEEEEEEEGYLLIITAIDDEREEIVKETAFSDEAEARAAYEAFDLDFFDPEHPMMWHAKTLVRGTELLEFEEQ